MPVAGQPVSWFATTLSVDELHSVACASFAQNWSGQFKRVATLHPEPEKQESTKKSNNQPKKQAKVDQELNQSMTNSYSAATKLNKTGSKQTIWKCQMNEWAHQLNNHKPEYTGVIFVLLGVDPSQ